MYFSPSRLVLAFTVVRVVVSLGIVYDKSTGLTKEEKTNKVRLDRAIQDAHYQVNMMRIGINRYKNKDQLATEFFWAAFGQSANAEKVDAVIKALENGNLGAELATYEFDNVRIIADVPWSKEDGPIPPPTPWTPGLARFSAKFHGTTLNDAGRAGTVIHEATHQLMKTGDNVNLSGNIIKPYDGVSKKSNKTGYTSNPNMHKTVEEVNGDAGFIDVRDTANNMHENAESYALFASLCSQPALNLGSDQAVFISSSKR